MKVYGADFSVNGIFYSITEGYTCSVAGADHSGEIVIPSVVEHNGIKYDVTSIGFGAFNWRAITSITIPPSITYIGSYSFTRCDQLKEVRISDLEAWCKIEFDGTNSQPLENGSWLILNNQPIEDLVVPKTITTIPSNSFKSYKHLKTLRFAGEIQSIENLAFAYCSNLVSVTLPQSVSSIGKNSFAGCTSLIKGAYPSTLDNPFPSSCFAFGYDSDNIDEINGVIYSKDHTKILFVPALVNDDFNIRESVCEIGASSFFRCNIKEISLPNSVTIISDNAFENCIELQQIVIPSSVLKIGMEAFSGCENLQSIELSPSISNIEQGVFYNCKNLETIKIPSSISSIKENAFMGCANLKSAQFASLEHLCSISFMGLESNPLYYAGKLLIDNIETIDLQIPSSVESIRDYAFAGLTELKSVTIPNSVKNIGKDAFNSCLSIDVVSFECVEHMFSVRYDNQNSNPLTFAKKIVIEDKEMSSIEVPSTISNINPYAFYGCNAISELYIPDSVSTIGTEAFKNCSELTQVVYVSRSSTWGDYVFSGCVNLKKFVVSNDFYKINYMPISTDIYTIQQSFNDAREYSGRRQLIAVPGIQASFVPGIGEITINVTADEGATFNSLTYEDVKIEGKNGEFTVSGLKPYNKYSFNFQFANEYYDNWNATIDFSTSGLTEWAESKIRTQQTLDIKVKYLDDKRISNKKIKVNGKEFNVDSNGNAKATGLASNTPYNISVYATFDGQEYNCGSFSTKTLPVNPAVRADISPTGIAISAEIKDKGDAIIELENFMVNGTNYANTVQRFVNQPLKSKFTARYSVNNEQAESSFTLPELELNTIAARAASKDCAIICAETNMSEEEYGGGFEWRRYDAPELVPSTYSPCPVANGHLEGRLKGLSQNTYYKYRPYYEDCNGDRTFGEWTAFITADADVYFEPTVYTYAPNSITKNSASVAGYAMGGSEDIDEQGFEYWPIVNSRATTEVRRVLAAGQRMIVTLNDLEPGTKYTVRAFVSTKSKTTYGAEQEFETDSEPIEDGIKQPTVEETEVAPFDIFTIQGVCVRRNTTDLSGLRPGLYIANGRKVIVR